MLVDLGQVVYVEDFERHFLEASSEFYRVSGGPGLRLLLLKSKRFRERQQYCRGSRLCAAESSAAKTVCASLPRLLRFPSFCA